MTDPTLVTVARTLREAASWIGEEDRQTLYIAAELVEAADDETLYMICPVCEETVCDEGCPLEELRAKIDAKERRWEVEAEEAEREESEAELKAERQAAQ